MKHLSPIFLFLLFTFCATSQDAALSPTAQKALDLYNQAEDIANNRDADYAAYIPLAEKALPLLKKT